MIDVDAILAAMRADAIPPGSSGRWTVSKRTFTPAELSKGGWEPPGDYTFLSCLTTPTMMSTMGEVVMNDFTSELRKHLEFIMLASGRVLIGGLGLGCVVRGLLARGEVDAIDVIERSEDVIRLCGASVEDPRVTIHKQDALHGFVRGGPWDYAWWDLWSDPERSEPHLQVTHMKLVGLFKDRVKNLQGAWAMPRQFRRPMRSKGVMI